MSTIHAQGFSQKQSFVFYVKITDLFLSYLLTTESFFSIQRKTKTLQFSFHVCMGEKNPPEGLCIGNAWKRQQRYSLHVAFQNLENRELRETAKPKQDIKA